MARAKAQGSSLGRKMLNLSVISLYDALKHSSSITAAAEQLNCSRAYIYVELAKYGATPKDVIEGRWMPAS